MRKTRNLIKKGCKAVQDLNLLKLLQSEIQQELSSDPFPKSKTTSLGDFVVEWDSPKTHDVFLRRKFECGEEVAISAKLRRFVIWGPDRDDISYTRSADMKVCVKKPGLSSLLQIDCNVWEHERTDSKFTVCGFYYLQSPAHLGPSVYRGPVTTHYIVKSKLCDALREYLVAKGIGEELTNFLLDHLHKKEQGQYVNWLQKLESFVAKPVKPE